MHGRVTYWIGCLACALVAAAAAAATTRSSGEQLTASAGILFRAPQVGPTEFSRRAAATDPDRAGANNVALVALYLEQSQLRENAQRRGYRVVTQSDGRANVVSIVCSGSDAATAVDIADRLARAFLADRTARLRAAGTAAVAALSDGGTAENRTRRTGRVARLAEINGLQGTDAELAYSGRPSAAASGATRAELGLAGGVAGLLLGAGVLGVRRHPRRALTHADEAAEALALPVLGRVGRADDDDLEATRSAFGVLYANLRFVRAVHELRVILVASDAVASVPEIGLRLAAAAAEAGDDAAVVELLPRPPAKYGRAVDGLPSNLAAVDARADISRYQLQGAFRGSGRREKALIRELRATRSTVIIDATALGSAVELDPLVDVVDGVLFEVISGQSRLATAGIAVEKLRRRWPVVGLVEA